MSRCGRGPATPTPGLLQSASTGDRTAKVLCGLARNRYVASLSGRRYLRSRFQQIRVDTRVEGDREDFPVPSVEAGCSGPDPGDSKLSAGAVGHLVEGVTAAARLDRGGRDHRPHHAVVKEQVAETRFGGKGTLRAHGTQQAGRDNCRAGKPNFRNHAHAYFLLN